jgi:hypothetical protein
MPIHAARLRQGIGIARRWWDAIERVAAGLLKEGCLTARQLRALAQI